MNEIREIQQIIQQLLKGIQDVIASGEILSDQFQGELAKTLQFLTTRLDQMLGQQEGDVQGLQATPTPPLEPGPFPSSNVNSFKYNPDTGQLFVKFHGKDSANSGPTYQYGNIPAYIYDVFSRGAIGPKTSGQNRYHRWIKNVTPSLGGTLNALIKAGNFPYRKVA